MCAVVGSMSVVVVVVLGNVYVGWCSNYGMEHFQVPIQSNYILFYILYLPVFKVIVFADSN